jgi:hypothetical protein
MSENLNAKEYIRKLINIAYINVGIPLLFFIWVYLESSSEQLIPLVDAEHEMLVFWPVLIFGAVLLFIGFRKFRQLLEQSISAQELSNKLRIYQKGLTIRFISYSFTSCLITIGFYLTDYKPFTFIFGLMIILFSIHSPNARRVAHNLKLKNEERLVILEGLDIPKSL